MDRYLAVAVGGAIGAVARFAIGIAIGTRFPGRFPYATFIINISGCFIIGFFLTLAAERFNIHPNWRLAIATGFVGAYTTFSAFEYETFVLLETGTLLLGVLNVVLSLVLGFISVWLGVGAARMVRPPQPDRSAATARLVERFMTPVVIPEPEPGIPEEPL